MDQIRKALAWLKQYHFWVLSVLVAIIALVCWKMAAATLSKEFAANKGTITGEFTNIQEFRNKPFLANKGINDKQLEQIEAQVKNVSAIWQALYERQSQGVLKWPPDLSQEFHDYVKTQKFGDPIPRDLRDNYRDYIDRHFESLPNKIGARVLAADEAGGMGGESFTRGFSRRGGLRGDEGGGFRGEDAGGIGVQDDDSICEWIDQGLVRQELDFPTTPSAIKIWVTQENLWVYHTLLDIIAKTNQAAGADRVSNAAVRTIYQLEVGQPAAMASLAGGRVEIIQAQAAGAAPGMEGDMTGDGMSREAAPMDGGGGRYGSSESAFMGEGRGFGDSSGGMSEEQEKAMLLASRYVDATGKPVGGGMAAAPMDGTDPSLAPPVGELPTGPFKRLPVRMTLKMDQRWLTHFISECANQPLPVEVTEVRILPVDASGTGDMGGFGRGEGGGRFGGFDRSGSGGGGSTFQPPVNPGDILTFKQSPHLATVVVQGIVTIFNEPDPNVLKVDSGEPMAATTP